MLQETAAQLRGCGLNVAPLDTLPKLLDIDTAEVWHWCPSTSASWNVGNQTCCPAYSSAVCAGLEAVGGSREEQARSRCPPSATCSGGGSAVLFSHSMRPQGLVTRYLCC